MQPLSGCSAGRASQPLAQGTAEKSRAWVTIKPGNPSSPLATLKRGVPKRGGYLTTLPFIPLPSREGSKPRHADTSIPVPLCSLWLCGEKTEPGF